MFVLVQTYVRQNTLMTTWLDFFDETASLNETDDGFSYIPFAKKLIYTMKLVALVGRLLVKPEQQDAEEGASKHSVFKFVVSLVHYFELFLAVNDYNYLHKRNMEINKKSILGLCIAGRHTFLSSSWQS